MQQYYVGSDRVNLLHDIDRPSMVSAWPIRKRKADIKIKKDQRWMMDSGAFSQISLFGDFAISPEKYMRIATRFQNSGALDCIVTQDYMCEPEVINELRNNGREASVRIHQRKTVERYMQLLDLADTHNLKVPIMPVLQGWEVEDYKEHLHMYHHALLTRFETKYERKHGSLIRRGNVWLGIGSTCKRNKNPEIVSRILDSLEFLLRKSGAKIHLFGYKLTGLRLASIRDRIYSADSFAYDFADRMAGLPRDSKTRTTSATDFHDKITNQPVQACLQLT